ATRRRNVPAASWSVQAVPEEPFAHEPATEHEPALVIEPAREVGEPERPLRAGDELELGHDPGGEANLSAFVDELCGVIVEDEVGKHRVPPQKRRVDVELLECPQLVEEVVANRPAPADE